MSNIFKPNSRFSSLLDDTHDKDKNLKHDNKNLKHDNKNLKHDKIFKDNKNNTYNHSSSSDNCFKYNNRYGKGNEFKKIEININNMNFPELRQITIPKLQIENNSSTNTSSKTFVNLLLQKKEEVSDIDENNKEQIKEGFIVLTKDKKTNKTIFKNSDGIIDLNKNNENPNIYDIEETELSSQEISYIMNTVVEKYIKRKEKYIEMWGYDEYEKNYLFVNYDYAYFDKLDAINEKYEVEFNNLNDDDFITNQDHFENYWKY